MFKCTVNYKDGTTGSEVLNIQKANDAITYTFCADIDYTTVNSIDLMVDMEITAGDDGYFVMPGGCADTLFKDSGLIRFKEHKDV